jgi:hypothetical protein
MSKLLSLCAAAIACAAVSGAATPAAKDYDVTSYMLSCGFDTSAQCQDMSSGRGGDCIRNPSLGGVASPMRTRQLLASIAKNNKGNPAFGASDRRCDVPIKASREE